MNTLIPLDFLIDDAADSVGVPEDCIVVTPGRTIVWMSDAALSAALEAMFEAGDGALNPYGSFVAFCWPRAPGPTLH